MRQKLVRQQRRAEQARELLKNPLINEIFDQLERTTFESWRDSSVSDRDLREAAWQKYQAIREVRQQFEYLVQTGRVAVEQMKWIQ